MLLSSPRRRNLGQLNLGWMLGLRWAAVIGQAAVIMVVFGYLAIDLPLNPLFRIVAATAASNLALHLLSFRLKTVPQALIAAVTALDIVLLTGLLYYTGGPTNPFNFLYLVHLALAAVVLSPPWAWSITALAGTCFGGLFWFHLPLGDDALSNRLLQQGRGVAFALAAVFIVYFALRITKALAQRERELADAREASSRSEKLTSLATLAAGAAHELATPLATIAIIAKELDYHLQAQKADDYAIEDVRLIRNQVERCRTVLMHMAADAGAGSGGPLVPASGRTLLERTIEGLEQAHRIDIKVDESAKIGQLVIPVRTVAQAMRGVVKNALDASPADARVSLSISKSSSAGWRIIVRDSGSGMPPEIATRAGEPFFTTKSPGLGMGLGLFLARTVLERLGGSLSIVSQQSPQTGTEVTMTLPLVSHVAAEDASL